MEKIFEGKTAIIDLCNFIDLPSNLFDGVKAKAIPLRAYS